MLRAHPKDASAGSPDRNVGSHDFVQELGAKVCGARVNAGMNVTELGRRIGVRYKQVQKYKAGTERIELRLFAAESSPC